MTALSAPEYIEQFKRTVAPLGRFEELNPEVLDSGIAGAIADAFGEAQISGFFPSHTISPTYEVTPDLEPRELALVMTYAGARYLRSQLAHVETRAAYEAGPTKYEIERAASLLKALLDDARAKLKSLEDDIKEDALRRGDKVYVLDWADLRDRWLP